MSHRIMSFGFVILPCKWFYLPFLMILLYMAAEGTAALLCAAFFNIKRAAHFPLGHSLGNCVH